MTKLAWLLAGFLISCAQAERPTVVAKPTAPAGHYADVHGLKMYYEVHGPASAAQTVVLLCGGTGWVEFWPSPIAYFGNQYRVVIPEPMGHGRTADDPHREFHYHDLAEDTVELLQQLHIKSAYFIGWSQGGVVGLDLAINHPDVVTKLAISGANFTPDYTDGETDKWLHEVKAQDWPFREAYERLSPDGPAHFPIVFERLKKMWFEEPHFTHAQLAGIKSPTMVVVGDHDMIKIEHTVELFQSIPKAQLWIVPGSGHMVPNERAPLFNSTVAEFFFAPGKP
jgi:pimeloyl-ACP methyl ester carboxylesterase